VLTRGGGGGGASCSSSRVNVTSRPHHHYQSPPPRCRSLVQCVLRRLNVAGRLLITGWSRVSTSPNRCECERDDWRRTHGGVRFKNAPRMGDSASFHV